MPTCYLPNNAIFIHVPKTGGSTVFNILRLLNMKGDYCVPKEPHPTLDKLDPRAFKFAFVRHPWRWIISMWRYLTLKKRARGLNFGDYLDYYYQEGKPMITPLVYSMIGPPGARIHYVGRQENLINDLQTALRLAGIPYEQREFDKLAGIRSNVSARTPLTYRMDQEKMVMELEKPLIDEFYR